MTKRQNFGYFQTVEARICCTGSQSPTLAAVLSVIPSFQEYESDFLFYRSEFIMGFNQNLFKLPDLIHLLPCLSFRSPNLNWALFHFHLHYFSWWNSPISHWNCFGHSIDLFYYIMYRVTKVLIWNWFRFISHGSSFGIRCSRILVSARGSEFP